MEIEEYLCKDGVREDSSDEILEKYLYMIDRLKEDTENTEEVM